MSATMLLALSLSLPGVGMNEAIAAAAAQAEDAVALPAPRPTAELRADLRKALRETAAIKKVDPVAAAERLLPLYIEVRLHPKFNEEDRLYYANTLRGRLKKLEKRIVDELDLDDPQREIAAQVGGAIGSNGPAVGGRGNQQERDRGRELVELIQTVIAPETWDVNGGIGSIYYYAPLRVLVVRQTADVHGRLKGVMGRLRGN